MDSEPISEEKAFQRWMNRHLVSMVLIYWHLDEKGNSINEPFVCASSGFIMAFGEFWFFVTAGHVIEDLNELISQPRVKVVDGFLVDSLGSQAVHHSNIPFNYEESGRYYEYADGLDFGFVVLDSNNKRLLQANNIEAISIDHWISQDIDKCTAFALIGIPNELVKIENRHTAGINIGTILYSVERVFELPEGADETTHERFIGKFKGPHNLESLRGTSGGPIVGFMQEGGQTKYWIVAVQSKCIKNKHVLGCPVKTFGQMLLDQIELIMDSVESEEQFQELMNDAERD